MIRFTGFLVLLVFFNDAYTQSKKGDKTKITPAQAFYQQGMERAQNGNYPLAAGFFRKAIEADSLYTDAYISLSGVYGELHQYKTSVAIFEKAISIDSIHTLDFLFPYAINLAGDGQFQKALNIMNKISALKPLKNPNALKAFEYRKKCFEFAVEHEKKYPSTTFQYVIKNMGDSVNSMDPEYFPSLTIDGKQLVFTRNLGRANEDFFYSQRRDSIWRLARKMEGDVNTPENEGGQNISQDGEWLVFTGCNRVDGFGSCDLYISYKTKSGWTEAENIGFPINSDQWDSQPCLSPDKQDLYFSSKRLGGFGGSDLYVAHRQLNGKWSQPENLGPGINTPSDEQCPFIHADNQTLYFTSKGLPGYGDEDIFIAHKGPSGSWSTPVNIGYPINTIDREGTLFVTADGRTAYYASERNDSRGALDIYTFTMRPEMAARPTTWVMGKVYDVKKGTGLPSRLELVDLKSKQVVARPVTDEQGNYLLTIPLGRDYAFNVNRKGYLLYSDNIDMSVKGNDSSYKKDIPLVPLEVGANVILKNVFFNTNRYELDSTSQVELDKLVMLMSDNPSMAIEISGHTDNVGKALDNQALSNKRANAVAAYILNKGVARNRITAKGYGAAVPVADNTTDKGRALNRRTEMKVVKL